MDRRQFLKTIGMSALGLVLKPVITDAQGKPQNLSQEFLKTLADYKELFECIGKCDDYRVISEEKGMEQGLEHTISYEVDYPAKWKEEDKSGTTYFVERIGLERGKPLNLRVEKFRLDGIYRKDLNRELFDDTNLDGILDTYQKIPEGRSDGRVFDVKKLPAKVRMHLQTKYDEGLRKLIDEMNKKGAEYFGMTYKPRR